METISSAAPETRPQVYHPPDAVLSRVWVRNGLLMLVAAAYLFPIVRVLYSAGDDGTSLYDSQLVSQGAIPGRDFVEVIGPGSFYWLGLLFRIFGTGWQVSRISLLAIGVASAGFLYAIAREVCEQWSADLSWLFLLVMGMPLWPVVSYHWDSNLMGFAAVWCYLQFEKAERPAWGIAAGALAGLTTCIVQQKGVALLGAIAVSALLRRKFWRRGTRASAWKALLSIGGAYAAVGALVLGAFRSAGALRDLVYANFLWPLHGYNDVNKTAYGDGLQSHAVYPAWQLFATHAIPRHLLVWLSLVPFGTMALLPLIAGISAAAWFVLKGRKAWSPIFALCLVGGALWLSEIHRKDVVHLAYGTPLLLIAWLAIAQPLIRFKLVKAAAGVLAASLVVFGTLNLMESTHGLHAVETRQGTVMTAEDYEALRFLQTTVKAGDYVFIYPYSPIYYYLADVRNPTRYSFLMYRYNTIEQFDEVVRDLETKRVEYVLDAGNNEPTVRFGFPSYRQPPADQLRVEPYLDRQYTQVGTISRFRILKRNSQAEVR